MNKLLPRVCGALDGNATENMLNFARSYESWQRDSVKHGSLVGKLAGEYGYVPGMVKGGTQVEATFDFVADQLRGFKGILMDVRKRPDQLEAAANATLPLMVKHIKGFTPHTPICLLMEHPRTD